MEFVARIFILTLIPVRAFGGSWFDDAEINAALENIKSGRVVLRSPSAGEADKDYIRQIGQCTVIFRKYVQPSPEEMEEAANKYASGQLEMALANRKAPEYPSVEIYGPNGFYAESHDPVDLGDIITAQDGSWGMIVGEAEGILTYITHFDNSCNMKKISVKNISGGKIAATDWSGLKTYDGYKVESGTDQISIFSPVTDDQYRYQLVSINGRGETMLALLGEINSSWARPEAPKPVQVTMNSSLPNAKSSSVPPAPENGVAESEQISSKSSIWLGIASVFFLLGFLVGRVHSRMRPPPNHSLKADVPNGPRP